MEPTEELALAPSPAPVLSYPQLFSFQISYTTTTSEPSEGQRVEWRKGILEVDFQLETLFVQDRDRIYLSHAFSNLRNHVEPNYSDNHSLSIKFDSGQWEIKSQNIAEKTCIQHLLECIVNGTSIEEAIQIGKEKGIIGLDKSIFKHGHVHRKAASQNRLDERYLILVPGKLFVFKNFDIIGKHVRNVTSLLGATVQRLLEEQEFQVSAPGSKTMSLLPTDQAELNSWVDALESSIEYTKQAAKAADLSTTLTTMKRRSRSSKARVQWDTCSLKQDAEHTSNEMEDTHSMNVEGTQIAQGCTPDTTLPERSQGDGTAWIADDQTPDAIFSTNFLNKISRDTEQDNRRTRTGIQKAMMCLENALDEMRIAIDNIRMTRPPAAWNKVGRAQFSPSKPLKGFDRRIWEEQGWKGRENGDRVRYGWEDLQDQTPAYYPGRHAQQTCEEPLPHFKIEEKRWQQVGEQNVQISPRAQAKVSSSADHIRSPRYGSSATNSPRERKRYEESNKFNLTSTGVRDPIWKSSKLDGYTTGMTKTTASMPSAMMPPPSLKTTMVHRSKQFDSTAEESEEPYSMFVPHTNSRLVHTGEEAYMDTQFYGMTSSDEELSEANNYPGLSDATSWVKGMDGGAMKTNLSPNQTVSEVVLTSRSRTMPLDSRTLRTSRVTHHYKDDVDMPSTEFEKQANHEARISSSKAVPQYTGTSQQYTGTSQQYTGTSQQYTDTSQMRRASTHPRVSRVPKIPILPQSDAMDLANEESPGWRRSASVFSSNRTSLIDADLHEKEETDSHFHVIPGQHALPRTTEVEIGVYGKKSTFIEQSAALQSQNTSPTHKHHDTSGQLAQRQSSSEHLSPRDPIQGHKGVYWEERFHLNQYPESTSSRQSHSGQYAPLAESSPQYHDFPSPRQTSVMPNLLHSSEQTGQHNNRPSFTQSETRNSYSGETLSPWARPDVAPVSAQELGQVSSSIMYPTTSGHHSTLSHYVDAIAETETSNQHIYESPQISTVQSSGYRMPDRHQSEGVANHVAGLAVNHNSNPPLSRSQTQAPQMELPASHADKRAFQSGSYQASELAEVEPAPNLYRLSREEAVNGAAAAPNVYRPSIEATVNGSGKRWMSMPPSPYAVERRPSYSNQEVMHGPEIEQGPTRQGQVDLEGNIPPQKDPDDYAEHIQHESPRVSNHVPSSSDPSGGPVSTEADGPTVHVSEIAELVSRLVKITAGEESEQQGYTALKQEAPIQGASMLERGSAGNMTADSITPYDSKNQHSFNRIWAVPAPDEVASTSSSQGSQRFSSQLNGQQLSSVPLLAGQHQVLNSNPNLSSTLQMQGLSLLSGEGTTIDSPITLKSADGEVIILGKERRSSVGPLTPRGKQQTEPITANSRLSIVQAQRELRPAFTDPPAPASRRQSQIEQVPQNSVNPNDEVDAWSLAILKPGAPAQIFKFETQ